MLRYSGCAGCNARWYLALRRLGKQEAQDTILRYNGCAELCRVLGLHNLICAVSPQRIILGGGVMDQRQLFPLVRRNVQSLLSDYVQVPTILTDIDHYIVPPLLGNRAGVLGAIALAQKAEKRC